MLVGTYTRGTTSDGIYALEFSNKGKLISQKLLAESDNPSFIALSEDKKFLYAVNEHGEESTVSAFAFDAEAGSLKPINKVNAAGADPCHLTVSENHVITANYSSGSVSIFERKANGSISEVVQVVEHPKKHFGNRRFGPSNAHQVVFSPNGKYLFATNLGTDMIFSYYYNPSGKTEVLTEISSIQVSKSSGPRHMSLSKDGKYLYLVQELNANVTVFGVSEDGTLNQLQETTLVTDASKKNGAADIHVSQNGKFVYVTNRGENNNISLFKINNGGTLKFQKQYSTEGNGPRNFTFSPDGKYIFIGNQRTNNIVTFKSNCRKGTLSLVDKNIEIGAPVCLLFY